MTGPRVVIIGAGIQGLSAAYHLIKLGVNDVSILESNKVGSGSSTRSASMLMLQRETLPKMALSIYSYMRYHRFATELDTDIGFRRTGFLSVATEGEAEVAIKRAHLRQSIGIPTDLLDKDQIRQLSPVVDTSDIEVGVYGPDDGTIDVSTILGALLTKLAKADVQVMEGHSAVGIDLVGSRIHSVRTETGALTCDYVVNAAGADAARVGSWVGLQLPLDNRRRSIFICTLSEPLDGPMIEDAEHEYYYRPYGERVLFGMGKDINTDISDSIDPETFKGAIAFCRRRFPGLSGMTAERGWSGIRPLTPDISPIIGPVEEVDGFINLCGWGGEGIQHAPAGGQLAAECIAFGEARSLEIGPFLYERFSQGIRTHGST